MKRIVRNTAARVLAACTTFLLAASAGAAELGWTAGPMAADGSTIRTDGTLVYAYSVQGGTVGGVAFDRTPDFADVARVSASPAPTGYKISDFQNAGVSGDFGHMLEGGWYWGYDGAATGELSATLTLSGLTAGKTYLVQLVVHRTSNSTLVSANGSTPVHISGNHDGVNYTYGGSIVGVFTATGTTADVVVTYSAASSGMRPLNAIQVRDLGEGQGGGGGATVVAPSIGSASATTNGTTSTIALSGIVLGTDDEGVAASSYSVSYSLTNALAETALQNQTGATASFQIADLADGNYTCEVAITTDKNKTASKSVSFAISTSGGGGGSFEDGWTAVAMGATSASIRTDGTLVYAYALGNYTVNGVEFAGVGNSIINNADCIVWEATTGAQSFGSSAPSDTESGDYKNLLQNGWWANGKARKIALNNLENGKQYLVQIVAFRQNYTTQSATAPDGQHTIHFDGTDWEYGGSLIGIFTASGASQEFTIDYAGQACINAIQVRELSAEPSPSSKPLIIAIE